MPTAASSARGDLLAHVDHRAERPPRLADRLWWRVQWHVGNARLRFRDWRGARPFWAGMWTLLASLIMLYPPLSALQIVFSGNGVWPGIFIAGLVLICAVMLWIELQLIRLLGTVIIFLSLLSFVTNTFGGFLVGMIVGIMGGAMALAWEAPEVAAAR